MKWPVLVAPLLLCLVVVSCQRATAGNAAVELEPTQPAEVDTVEAPLVSTAVDLTFLPIAIFPWSTTSADSTTSMTSSTVSSLVATTSLLQNGPASINLGSAGIQFGAVAAATVDDRGSLQVASSAIGWYPHEAGLGRPGTALLAAHVAYNGENGPFRRLEEVAIGDALDVVLADGTTYSYVVESIATYLKKEIPIDQLTGMTGPDRVALVTCTGGFDPKRRSYDSNLVVIANRI